MSIVKLTTVAAALALGAAGASFAQSVTTGGVLPPAGTATGTVGGAVNGSTTGLGAGVNAGATTTLPGATAPGVGVGADSSMTTTIRPAPSTSTSTGVNASTPAPLTAAEKAAEARRKAGAANPDGHDVAPADRP